MINQKILLEKYPGKGGWTYALIPELKADKNQAFGWLTVSGFIDEYEIKNYKLMPNGKGQLFLPVKKEIRKIIKKEAGDYVQIKLQVTQLIVEIPEEIISCLKNEPSIVYSRFLKLSDSTQKNYLDWIYNAKTEETKANRIAAMIQQISDEK